MLGQKILFALWLFWPAGIGTLLPVFAAHLPVICNWDYPMDAGQTWRGHRLLGDHKTWRGFLAGWLGGSLWGLVMVWLYHHSHFIRDFYPTNFPVERFLLIAVLISLGSVVGDAVGSFAKRQLDIPSGTSWFPYDQLDFIVGGMVLSLPIVRLDIFQYATILVVWLGIHLVFGVLGYITGLKDAVI